MDRDENYRPGHITIRDHHKLPPDIDRGLFDSFFHRSAFIDWQKADRPWQLHLSGGPGCGKTILSCLIAAHLKQNTPYDVATIFVQSHVSHEPAETELSVDDILSSILYQLQSYETRSSETHLPAVNGLDDIVERSSYQSTTSLKSQETCSSTGFLIIDGFDQLPRVLQSSLQGKLEDLGSRFRVLLTRRVPVFQPFAEVGSLCNACEVVLENQFWQCSLCDHPGVVGTGFDICYDCKENNIWCNFPGHENALAEPYTHIDVDVSHVDEMSLEMFATKDLQTEYDEPKSLLIGDVKTEPYIAQLKAESITRKSYNDLAITKLRLDQVRETDSFQSVEMVSDRLPRGVIAFYDSELDRIEAKTDKEMELVLIAFLMTTERDGMPIEDLEEALQLIAGTPIRTEDDHPYVRTILHLSRGLVYQYALDWRIYHYHQDFKYYVQEGYNQDIVSCENILETHRRRETSQAVIDSAPKMQSPEIDEGFFMEFVPPTISQPLRTNQATNVQGPPSILSRQTSTDSTDSGYFSESPPPERELATVGTISLRTRNQNTKKTRPKQGDTREAIIQVHSLCNFCEEMVFQSQTTHGYHHKPVKHLAIASSQGCPFCSHIYVCTEECMKNIKTDHRTLHECSRRYWTLRTTGKTSNGHDICAVTFQVPRISETQCYHSSTIAPKRFFLIAETDLDHIPTIKTLNRSTQLKDAGAQITAWIQDCDANHPGCEYNSTDDFVPTRLVDIATGDSQIVRVIDTAKNGITRPYATLSHCWGKQMFLTLQRANEKLLTTEGVHISELTRNFQEAIEVARFIGMRYIWIDSLCIVQGEDGDFHTEGQYMHKVYRFSYCNIVAADSPDSTHGLFRKRNPKSILPAAYEAGKDSIIESGSWRILEEDLWQNELLDTPIYTRGWVFQERMLSPRILHFTKSQVYWDCSTRSACEALPEGLPFNLDRFASTDRHWRGRLQETTDSAQAASITGANDDSMETFWKTALLKYTECDLTNQGDKAVAIWSIAKLVRDQYGPDDEYGGGLWSVALHEQLAWRARDCRDDARLEELQFSSPSWSWASVKGAIIAQDRLAPDRCYQVESHDGGEVTFQLEESDGNRDRMPMLKEPFSIDMNGYFGEGRLHKDGDQSDTSRLEIFTPWDRAGSRGDEGIFQVYLDQKISLASNSWLGCHFAVLAASNDCYFSQSEREEPTQNTKYSGIGLVLEPHEAFKRRTGTTLKEILPRLFNEEPPVTSAARHSRDNLIRRIVSLCKLLGRENLHAPGPHFRRIGALHFRNVSVETWSAIEGHGRTKFWLV